MIKTPAERRIQRYERAKRYASASTLYVMSLYILALTFWRDEKSGMSVPFPIWMRRAALIWAIIALAMLLIAPPEMRSIPLAGLSGYLVVIIAYSLRMIYNGLRRIRMTYG